MPNQTRALQHQARRRAGASTPLPKAEWSTSLNQAATPVTQYVQNNTSYQALVETTPRRQPRLVAADELRRLDRLFTPPPGFGDARHVLAVRRIVLLDGIRGCGRDAAARILLHELGGRARMESFKEEEFDKLLDDVTKTIAFSSISQRSVISPGLESKRISPPFRNGFASRGPTRSPSFHQSGPCDRSRNSARLS